MFRDVLYTITVTFEYWNFDLNRFFAVLRAIRESDVFRELDLNAISIVGEVNDKVTFYLNYDIVVEANPWSWTDYGAIRYVIRWDMKHEERNKMLMFINKIINCLKNTGIEPEKVKITIELDKRIKPIKHENHENTEEVLKKIFP